MLLVHSTLYAHKTPSYQPELKIGASSDAGWARQIIVMLKENLNTILAIKLAWRRNFWIEWTGLDQRHFWTESRGTFTRFNVERTYQMMKMKKKKTLCSREKSIQNICFKYITKKKNHLLNRLEDISLKCSENSQVNTSFILLLQMDGNLFALNHDITEERQRRRLVTFEIERRREWSDQNSQHQSKFSMD